MDELVSIAAITKDDGVFAVGDPLEEDAEDAQPTVAEDRAGPHDRYIQTIACGIEARPLCGELCVSVGLHRRRYGGRKNGIYFWDTEHCTR